MSEAERRHIEAELDRAPGIVPVDALGEEGGIVLEREVRLLAAQRRGGEEAEIEHRAERQEHRHAPATDRPAPSARRRSRDWREDCAIHAREHYPARPSEEGWPCQSR